MAQAFVSLSLIPHINPKGICTIQERGKKNGRRRPPISRSCHGEWMMARKVKSNPSRRIRLPGDCAAFFDSLKQRNRQVQTMAMLSVNRELIALYWDIGREIVLRHQREGWGKSVIDRLAADIQRAFPGIRWFSPRSVWRMRALFPAYCDARVVLRQLASDSGDAILAQPAQELAEEEVAQSVRQSPKVVLP